MDCSFLTDSRKSSCHKTRAHHLVLRFNAQKINESWHGIAIQIRITDSNFLCRIKRDLIHRGRDRKAAIF